MKRFPLLMLGGLVFSAVGGLVGYATAQPQQEPDYLVISIYDPPPGRSWNDAIEEMSQVVRIHRESGAYKSVRLFGHNWGPESAFYMLAEPNDWASIPRGFEAQLEAQPNLFDLPDNWEAHSDNILTEIPVN